MLLTAVPFFVVAATWRLPDTYHSAGSEPGDRHHQVLRSPGQPRCALQLTCRLGRRHRPGSPTGLIRSLPARCGVAHHRCAVRCLHPGRCRPQPPLLEGATAVNPMLAEQVDAVIGVDTHTDTHTACLLDAA